MITYSYAVTTETDLIAFIKKTLRDRGIHLSELSMITGFARSALSMMLNNERRMPIEIILKCLELTGWEMILKKS